MLHNAVVLYRRTISFSYIASTNQSPRLRIPTVLARADVEADAVRRLLDIGARALKKNQVQVESNVLFIRVEILKPAALSSAGIKLAPPSRLEIELEHTTIV